MSQPNVVISAKDAGVLRTLLGMTGVVAVGVGLLVLIWPGRTAAVVAGVVAVYGVLAGLLYVAIGVLGARGGGGWWRLGYVALGLVFVVVAVLALTNLRATAAFLATLLGIMIGAVWVVQGIGTIVLARYAPSTPWAVVNGVVSIVGGVVLLFSPILSTLVLWWLLGAALVVVGIVQVMHAITVGRSATV
ncbi:DUF308 domain-containing protein [Isoptericola sp. b490]|uniref:DUF308 domain-containing protein n=1 Tax=Actinotalea lenta TaxID=3064654 RepID=UPI0027128734|nr:DUF308 domain-containing protein [Isoptericola sp. b490]MDO8122460.1 DUF308 domain-containing protein [Isoptericola sp. b490]